MIRQYEPGTQSQSFMDCNSCTESNVAKLTFEEVTDYLTINDQVMVIDKKYAGYVEILLQSPDEAAELFAHIMKVSKIYILFCDCIRQGYAILIESIMVECLWRYKFSGKRRYVDIFMRMMDTNYDNLPFKNRKNSNGTNVKGLRQGSKI